MRGARLPFAPSRVRGKASLIRRLGALLIATHRFGRCRAATPADLVWTAKLMDNLQRTLDEARL
jgi:hypothetical protein